MTRSEFIQALTSKFPELTAKDVELSVNHIFNEMSQTLGKHDRIEIRGFGSFGINHHPERKGRNPKSGETVMVPAKDVPHFKAGKELRERVDYE
jgi:integration host factor subunit beta